MKIRKYHIGILSGIILLGLILWLVFIGATSGTSSNTYQSLKVISEVFSLIQTRYVDNVSPDSLMKGAIEGMLKDLDPHTIYMSPGEYKDMYEMDIKGEFGGLGITIGLRDGLPTVISPLPGTPASKLGIQAGDRIVKINGESTKGLNIDQVVKKLRGPKGTQVNISVEREGESALIDFTITRDIIEIKSVPYSFMIGDIGYIRLVHFSEKTDIELTSALQSILLNKPKGLILDLRSNPGGLLNQAVRVSEKFVGKGRKIVYTQGRLPEDNTEYKAEVDPIIPGNIPLIILVDRGSASASEIVSGAAQDWDRGLIVGTTTFGKGSVQNLMRLSNGGALKITISKYYTPSGRCINRDEIKRQNRNEPSDTTQQEVKVDKSKQYKTSAGRIVYGGGGITPDIEIKYERPPEWIEKLERKTLFFKFAIQYTAYHKNIDKNFVVDNAMLNEFKALLKKENFEYKEEDFKAQEFYIKTAIRREITSKLFGDTEGYKVGLELDNQLQKTLGLFQKAKTLSDLFKMASNKE